ncbi:OLC1v1023952C2 [Oldenlandia corymbosa var. corymbosa]|uniref:OLC1v1023952C2 n=1 Tax=Oldenlandia corymbosa var. corymbosa TaxID=529605 RepID=A0AAV1C1J4_OLDCO|nr:OLC1v1023952C2 [Oldenlandia corymbosa var. corymbosa]
MESPRAPSTSTPKMERRIIEKNRRNHMKSLYSKLYSLLPSYGSKEVLPAVPDQIDEARMYIESLQKKLEMYHEEKEKLLKLQGKMKPNSSSSAASKNETLNNTSKLTNVEIHEMGPNMDVVCITGLEDQASFYGIIRLLSNQGFEIVHANFSINGNSVIQISYEKVPSNNITDLIFIFV